MAMSLEFAFVERLVGQYQFHFSVEEEEERRRGGEDERRERRERREREQINHKNHGQIQSSIFRSSFWLSL